MNFSGLTVLVTGAGGSIGSEVALLLHQSGARVVLLDRDESLLHATQLKMAGRADLGDGDVVLADIRDEAAICRAFKQIRPDAVIHSAALKHVSALEKFPFEGWQTNVVGTLNVLKSCLESGVERVVNVSTDKAADPESVLGKTKMIAEQLTAWAADQAPGKHLVSVRFGNVIGSRGSVFETWRAQISRGGPLTLSDENAMRYFISVRQAAEALLSSTTRGKSGQVLVMRMADPIRVGDVARQQIASSGKNVEIIETGLQQGEKLSEILVGRQEEVVAQDELFSYLNTAILRPDELEFDRLGE